MSLDENADRGEQIAELWTDVGLKLEAMRADLAGKLEATRADILRKLDSLEKSLSSAKIWTLVLYLALAGSLLYAMARGFKWI